MNDGALGSAETAGEGQTFAGGLVANAEEAASCLALVFIVLSVCWAVVTRYITATPATWAGEISAAAFAWLIFIGSAAGFKRGLHVAIDMLVDSLPTPAGRLILRIVDVMMFAFCLYISFVSWGFTMDNWDNPTPALHMPYAIHYMSATVGFILMTFRYAQAAAPRWLGSARG